MNFSWFYLDSDSFLREDLELGPVIGHISEELLLIAIPLDAVQGVSLHIKPVGNIIFLHDFYKTKKSFKYLNRSFILVLLRI